jgi:hypothetical protein
LRLLVVSQRQPCAWWSRSPPHQLPRRRSNSERPRRIPALAVEGAALPLPPVVEDGAVAVEQFPGCDQLVAVSIAGERHLRLDGLDT